MTKKKRVFKPKNPIAKELHKPLFNKRVVPSKAKPKPNVDEEWD